MKTTKISMPMYNRAQISQLLPQERCEMLKRFLKDAYSSSVISSLPLCHYSPWEDFIRIIEENLWIALEFIIARLQPLRRNPP